MWTPGRCIAFPWQARAEPSEEQMQVACIVQLSLHKTTDYSSEWSDLSSPNVLLCISFNAIKMCILMHLLSTDLGLKSFFAGASKTNSWIWKTRPCKGFMWTRDYGDSSDASIQWKRRALPSHRLAWRTTWSWEFWSSPSSGSEHRAHITWLIKLPFMSVLERHHKVYHTDYT